jgi:Tfp pilus assembly protein PilN
MIEINLLPDEYRRPDGTPVPMVLTIVMGVIVVGSLTAWLVILAQTRQNLRQTKDDKTELASGWKIRAAKVDAIVKEINAMKKRQQTIMEISRSKIMWSQKLFQLSQIFSKYNKFWVQTISMNQVGLSGNMTLSCFALGNEVGEVSDFRTYMEKDETFFYHFKDIQSPRITFVPGVESEPDKLQFSMTLILKDNPVTKKK